MNNPTPSPPDPGCKLTGSVEDYPTPAPVFHLQKYLVFLRRYWWVPVITLTLAVSAAVGYLLWIPPAYVSTGRLWETEKLRLPEWAFFAQDSQNSLGTQTELLRSNRLRQMALARLLASATNAVPLGKDGQPLAVLIKVTQVPKNSIFAVEASSSVPDYTQTYLDALMNEYLEYKKNVRKLVSGDILASISAQVLRLEQDLKVAEDAITTFQRTNNLTILQAQGTVAVDCLAKLNTQLSDLQLEDLLLKGRDLSPAETASRQTIQLKMEYIRNSIREWETKVVETNVRIADAERLKLNVNRAKSQYDRLVNLLQNVDVSRNIDQSTLSILELASPAERTYTREKRLLAIAGLGVFLGLGIIVLMELYRGLQRRPSKPNPRLGQGAIKPSAAERLEQIKGLQEKGLLSKEAYERKVEQIVDSL